VAKSGTIFVLLYLFTNNAMTAEFVISGEQLFRNNCMACHQENGQGIVNVFPALAGSEVVTGSPDDVALVVLIGRGAMPSFKGNISNEELASIINYVRNEWGNVGSLIDVERVAQIADTVN